jgi:uncharacterized protein with PIN domain
VTRGWTAAQRKALATALATGAETRCPECGATLACTPVPPPPEVAYVRSRVLLVCPDCHRSASLDLKR